MPGYTTKKEQQWHRAFQKTIKARDMRDVVKVLIEHAKAGDSWAIKLFLDRCLGTAAQEIRVQADLTAPGAVHLDFSK